jgi:hypothetical protein
MNSTRHHAIRLALFLDSVGIKPCVDGSSYSEYVASLNTQFLGYPRIPLRDPVTGELQSKRKPIPLRSSQSHMTGSIGSLTHISLFCGGKLD